MFEGLIPEFVRWLLHFAPFVHFYKPWEDMNEPNSHEHTYQKRYCCVCNKLQLRWTQPE